jgi:16S rRNA (adenine1518-N6/adenine1519-N6)-dimethyltransferase
MRPHYAKKRLGQNFLVDDYIIQQIVSLIHPNANDHLVEIGPGLGAITVPLSSRVGKLDAIELDQDVVPLLKNKVQDKGQFAVHLQDALNLDLSTLSNDPKSLRIVGNLPYNISTPLLFHLFQQLSLIIDMHFMVQREVAERLAACPGNKQYGRLSVMAQYHCSIEQLLAVPPNAFRPVPKVQSEFIRLMPAERILQANNISLFEQVVRQAFNQRRKTIHNSLKQTFTQAQIISLGINPMLRAEDLTVDDFVRLGNLFGEL